MASLSITRHGRKLAIILEYDDVEQAKDAYYEAQSQRLDNGSIHISDDNRRPPGPLSDQDASAGGIR